MDISNYQNAKKLKGFTSYAVTNCGVVFSLPRVVLSRAGQLQPFEGKKLNIRNNKIQPHLFFEVSKVEDDKKVRKTFYIHKVVAELFIPKPSKKHIYVTHIDGNYYNNHMNNLKWITHKELMANQPLRKMDPTKAWRTRRKKYGKSGIANRSLIKTK